MAQVAAPLFIAQGVMGAMAALQSGRDQQAMANRNAAQARQNAVIAEQNAAAQEESFRREARRRQGARRAAAGASGLQLTGSPLAVLQDAAMEEELDALELRYQGDLKAQGFRRQADADEFRGRIAKRNSISKAGMSLLGGFTNASQV